MAYLLDSDVFITGKNLYYGMEICPGFWEWLDVQHAAGKVFSIEKVKDELLEAKDELSDWARERGEDFFLPPDDKLIVALQEVTKWAQGPRFKPAAIQKFMTGADLFLIAHAKAHGHTVVTLEAPAPDATAAIKIPTACLALQVKCIDTFQLLRREQAKFVLDGLAPRATKAT